MPANPLPTNVSFQTDLINQKLSVFIDKRSGLNDKSLPELQSLVDQIINSLRLAENTINQTNSRVNTILP
jgi:hypothetical protein